MSFIYLGSPYTDVNPDVEDWRYEIAAEASCILVRNKIAVYCPIATWHPMARKFGLRGDADFWWQQDVGFLRHAIQGWFLRIPGINSSVGVKTEMEFLRGLGKKVILLDPADVEETCKQLHRNIDATSNSAATGTDASQGNDSRGGPGG